MSTMKNNDRDPTAPLATPSKTTQKLPLAELLARSMEEDAVVDPKHDDRERWDDDEGTFGG